MAETLLHTLSKIPSELIMKMKNNEKSNISLNISNS